LEVDAEEDFEEEEWRRWKKTVQNN
jgi:hypothetical protein